MCEHLILGTKLDLSLHPPSHPLTAAFFEDSHSGVPEYVKTFQKNLKVFSLK